MRAGDEKKLLYISFGISAVLHLVLVFPFFDRTSIIDRIMGYDPKMERAREQREDIALIASDALPSEPDDRTPFVSDRNAKSQSKRTPKTGYNIYARDNTKVSLSRDMVDQPYRPDLVVQTVRGEQGTENSGETTDKGADAVMGKKTKPGSGNDALLMQPGQEEKHARKMPFIYDESEEIKVGFSLDDGRLVLGSRLMPHAGYCIEFVNAIRESFSKNMSPAMQMRIVKDDEVEVLFSIDGRGKIEFVSVTKASLWDQESFQTSCIWAVQYAGQISPPPYELMQEEGRDGKLYIPFKFQYRDLRNN